MESVYNRIYKNFIKFRLTFAIKTYKGTFSYIVAYHLLIKNTAILVF